MISVINLVFNIINESSDVFVGSIYLLLVPYFKFLQSHNYIEIIPAAFFFTLTIFLLYKSSQYYYKSDKSSPLLVFVSMLWTDLSSVFASIAFTSSNPDNSDMFIANIVFFCILGFYQSAMSIMIVCEYYKDKPNTYHFSAANTDDIYKSRYLITTLASLIVVSAATLKYVCSSELMLKVLKIWYLGFLLLFFIFAIGFVIDYKRIVRKLPDQKWNKETSFKFVLIQFLSISLYVTSYIVLHLI